MSSTNDVTFKWKRHCSVSYFPCVLPLHNPPRIKSSRYFPVCSFHRTCWSYIPYLCWIALAAGSIVPVDIEKEAQAPSVIWCPVGLCYLQGTLVSFCLLSIMCVFLSVAGIWLQDISWDEMTIVPLFHFIFLILISIRRKMFRCVRDVCTGNSDEWNRVWTHKGRQKSKTQGVQI